MEDITTKILDNTFISAGVDEIKCVNIIKICSGIYPLSTTLEVYNETKREFDNGLVEEIYKYIDVPDVDDKIHKKMILLLENRFPYLGSGEISSFLLAFLEYSTNNKKYYYVTDDGLMRQSTKSIIDYYLSIDESNIKINKNFKITGTVGLIRRLYERGALTANNIDDIIKDLENSTFRITPELLCHLRQCYNESESKT